MIQLFKNIFGDKFIYNTAIIFTHWSLSREEVSNRKRSGITEQLKALDFNRKLRELLFDYNDDRKCFYIDNSISLWTEEEKSYDGAE